MNQLMTLVYGELRQLAAGSMAREWAVSTLQPTALVHEAWLRLGGDQRVAWKNRRHFFGAAALAMRQILIERSRRRQAVRHGGGQERVDAGALDRVACDAPDDRIAMVSEAIERLSHHDAAKAELVRLRYFVGLTLEQVAQILDISLPTAHRWWAFSRAWLQRELERERIGSRP